jgi:hypothetical protein
VRLLRTILALFFVGSAAAEDWKEYDNPEYSFTIHFPADPTIGATIYRTGDGRVPGPYFFGGAETGMFSGGPGSDDAFRRHHRRTK